MIYSSMMMRTNTTTHHTWLTPNKPADLYRNNPPRAPTTTTPPPAQQHRGGKIITSYKIILMATTNNLKKNSEIFFLWKTNNLDVTTDRLTCMQICMLYWNTTPVKYHALPYYCCCCCIYSSERELDPIIFYLRNTAALLQRHFARTDGPLSAPNRLLFCTHPWAFNQPKILIFCYWSWYAIHDEESKWERGTGGGPREHYTLSTTTTAACCCCWQLYVEEALHPTQGKRVVHVGRNDQRPTRHATAVLFSL